MRIALALAALSASIPGAEPDSGKPISFEKKVQQYVGLRKEAAREAGKLSDKSTPEEIAAHKQALQRAIQKKRAGAKPGELLSAEAFELISAVRSETAGPDDDNARQAVLEDGNPVSEGAPFTPRVNASYPESAPRSTVPPDVLAKLPELPKGLEFRFVGRTLILYDAEANLIVDFITNAISKEK